MTVSEGLCHARSGVLVHAYIRISFSPRDIVEILYGTQKTHEVCYESALCLLYDLGQDASSFQDSVFLPVSWG